MIRMTSVDSKLGGCHPGNSSKGYALEGGALISGSYS